jgi:hypothetical protein
MSSALTPTAVIPTTLGAAYRLTNTNASAAMRLAFSAVNELSKYVIGTVKDLKSQQSDTKRLKKKIEELQQNLEDRDRRTEQLEGRLRAITLRVKALEEKGEPSRGENALVEIPPTAIVSAGFEDWGFDPQELYDSGIEEQSVASRRLVDNLADNLADNDQPELFPWASQKIPDQTTFTIQYTRESSSQPKPLKRKRPHPDTEGDSSDEVYPSKHKKGHVRQGKCLFSTLEKLSQQGETRGCAKLAAKTLQQLRIEIGAKEAGALTKEQEIQLGQKKKPLAAYSKAYIDLFNELRDSEHWPDVQTAYKKIKNKQAKKAKINHTKKPPPLDSKLHV